MKLKTVLLFVLSKFVLGELKHYVAEEYFRDVTHTEVLSAKTEMMCAIFCVQRKCSNFDYEQGELK